MVFGRPTTVQDVLAAIASRAATAGTWISAEYVWQTLDIGELYKTGFPQDTVIQLGDLRGNFYQPDIAGGGNYVMTVDGVMDVTIHDRLSVDEAYKDTTRLQSSTLGIVKKWHDLLRVLSMYSPTESVSGECILEEPMRPLAFAMGKANVVNGWASITTPFEIKFRLELSGQLDFSGASSYDYTSQYLLVVL